MTASEVITVVVQSPTDFTGPMIGIAGVLIGSALALVGLRWQHNAQKTHEVRQKGADMIFLGEKIERHLNTPRLSWSSVRPGETKNSPPNPLDAWVDEMTSIFRYLELVAPSRTFWLSFAYWDDSKSLIEFEGDDHWPEVHASWVKNRQKLIDHLRKPRGPVMDDVVKPRRRRIMASR